VRGLCLNLPLTNLGFKPWTTESAPFPTQPSTTTLHTSELPSQWQYLPAKTAATPNRTTMHPHLLPYPVNKGVAAAVALELERKSYFSSSLSLDQRRRPLFCLKVSFFFRRHNCRESRMTTNIWRRRGAAVTNIKKALAPASFL
jgi:hypothetical protein